MIPDNVTLVVKAPNQQIEDQNIECVTSWTVKQLKGHLAEVYPSKPSSDEQKIIYSGQLLDDNVVLKDILRSYDSQIVHTMHLVCTPTRRMAEHKQAAPVSEGIRHRNVGEGAAAERPAEAETVSRPEVRQNNQNHNAEMHNYLSSFVNNYGRVPPPPPPPYPASYGPNYLPVPNDPALYAHHMMMMHQAYVRYMQQYANMWQTPTGPNVGGGPQVGAEPPPQPAAAEAPAAAGEEGEEAAPRDWLDHLYAASRLAILFSLVYLYGSPARLLLVLMLAAAGYLHQIGFFRDLHVNAPNNAPPPRRDGQAGVANRMADFPEPVDEPYNNNNYNRDAVVREPDAANGQPDAVNRQPDAANRQSDAASRQGETVTNDNNNVDRQSLLAVTWMIFTSFFASLIPDTN